MEKLVVIQIKCIAANQVNLLHRVRGGIKNFRDERSSKPLLMYTEGLIDGQN